MDASHQCFRQNVYPVPSIAGRACSVLIEVCRADSTTATVAVTQALTYIACHTSLKSHPLSVCLFKTERAYSFCGTIEYMAPDIVRGGDSGHDKVGSAFDPSLCISRNCSVRVIPH
jgi:hypothetical protein